MKGNFLLLFIFFTLSIQFACQLPEPPKGMSKCTYHCPNEKILEEIIPKEAKDYCIKEGLQDCKCNDLLVFFEKNMRHISYNEVISLMEQKCKE